MRSKKKDSEAWKAMIEHIDQHWLRLKDRHYPFAGRDFRNLKEAVRHFQEYGIMALFDVYVKSKSEFPRKSGYSLDAFFKCLPWLMDDKDWKERAKQYEAEILPKLSTELSKLLEFPNFNLNENGSEKAKS